MIAVDEVDSLAGALARIERMRQFVCGHDVQIRHHDDLGHGLGLLSEGRDEFGFRQQTHLLQAFGIDQQPVHVEDRPDDRPAHPFTPVMVIPWMKSRRAKRKAATSGAVTMVAAAKVTP
ncbi:hypothetical protein MesoLjLc_53490 [Mesorhizobium sp. L-8-10]|nr:hypothetical protein MesoLjLc_53490 [Mesorhizobium sp. L-8-10]